MDRWREILKEIIGDTREKRRIAETLGLLSVRTLDRWADGFSAPKNSQVIQSIGPALPFLQEEMNEALREAFPDAFKTHAVVPHQQTNQNSGKDIPAEFIWRVLHAYSTIQPALRQWTIANLVTEQLLSHLDPDSTGMGVVFAPYRTSGNDTVPLQEAGGSGLWDARQLAQREAITLEPYTLLLSVLTTGTPRFIQAFSDGQACAELEVFLHAQDIRAFAIYPVQRSGEIAGTLLLCAREADFFFLKRRQLLERYVHLYALAYTDLDFHTHTR